MINDHVRDTFRFIHERLNDPWATYDTQYLEKRNNQARWVLRIALLNLNDWRSHRRTWIEAPELPPSNVAGSAGEPDAIELRARARYWSAIDRDGVLADEAAERAKAESQRATELRDRGDFEAARAARRRYDKLDLEATALHLAAVAAALNTRPRKTLDWRTPAEVLNEHLEAAA
jgi:hypothetical protein